MAKEIEVSAQIISQQEYTLPPKAVGGKGFGFDVFGYAMIGSSDGDVIAKIVGLGRPGLSASPFTVLCQTRQSENVDRGYTDQFAVQVIETGRDFFRVRIRRIDADGAGWGQKLRLDFGIIN